MNVRILTSIASCNWLVPRMAVCVFAACVARYDSPTLLLDSALRESICVISSSITTSTFLAEYFVLSGMALATHDSSVSQSIGRFVRLPLTLLKKKSIFERIRYSALAWLNATSVAPIPFPERNIPSNTWMPILLYFLVFAFEDAI